MIVYSERTFVYSVSLENSMRTSVVCVNICNIEVEYKDIKYAFSIINF